jgi:hypothetical protein
MKAVNYSAQANPQMAVFDTVGAYSAAASPGFASASVVGRLPLTLSRNHWKAT